MNLVPAFFCGRQTDSFSSRKVHLWALGLSLSVDSRYPPMYLSSLCRAQCWQQRLICVWRKWKDLWGTGCCDRPLHTWCWGLWHRKSCLTTQGLEEYFEMLKRGTLLFFFFSNWKKTYWTLKLHLKKTDGKPWSHSLLCTYSSLGITRFLPTYFQLFVQDPYLIFLKQK